MSKIDDIKHAISQLSPPEMRAFRDWLNELIAQRWDEQIERDVKAGKLDWLAEEALADHRAGRSTDLFARSRKASDQDT